MPSGKVKWFNSKKGYGFITDDKTNKDIFLHVSALEESKLRVLKEEQVLKFDIKEEKDKLQAINIIKIIVFLIFRNFSYFFKICNVSTFP